MIDREKVINGLETIRGTGGCPDVYYMDCKNCVYEDDPHCVDSILRDAIALLKAQEPKPPVITENAYGWKFYHCSKCGREFYMDRLHGRVNAMKFCDKCGQAVKWDG